MRKLLWIAALIFLASCERDDLCLENTKPQAVIRFHNRISGQPSRVDSLAVYYEGQELLSAQKTDSLLLPLPVDRDTARYVFVHTHGSTFNPDTLQMTFQRKEVFVSKACGFKMTYDHLQVALIPDSDNWIQQIDVTRTQITDDTLAHIRIYY